MSCSKFVRAVFKDTKNELPLNFMIKKIQRSPSKIQLLSYELRSACKFLESKMMTVNMV